MKQPSRGHPSLEEILAACSSWEYRDGEMGGRREEGVPCGQGCPLPSLVTAALGHVAEKQAHGTYMFLDALSSTTHFFGNELRCYHWQIRTVRPKAAARSPLSCLKCWVNTRPRDSIPPQNSPIAPGYTQNLTEKDTALRNIAALALEASGPLFSLSNEESLQNPSKKVSPGVVTFLRIRQDRPGAVLQEHFTNTRILFRISSLSTWSHGFLSMETTF